MPSQIRARVGSGPWRSCVYLLWNAIGPSRSPSWPAELLGPVAEALLALEPAGLAMNIADDDAAAVSLPLPPPADDPAPFAEVTIWLGCHDDRGPYEAVLAPAGRSAGRLPGDRVDPHRLRRQRVGRAPGLARRRSARPGWSCSRSWSNPSA